MDFAQGTDSLKARTMIERRDPHHAVFKDWDLKADIVYGPFHTRRQGLSLGINLLPPLRKQCTFNCVYCQCGWTRERLPAQPEDFADYPSPARVRREIERRFAELSAAGTIPDAIIVSGNGEPTLYPWLDEAIDAVLDMRERFFAGTRTGILTAGTELGRDEVRSAIDRLDERMVKVDAGSSRMQRRVNLPLVDFDLDRLECWARRLRDCIVQTCFIQGRIDNTSTDDVDAWIARVGRIGPKRAHLYSLDRTPPAPGLRKARRAALKRISSRLHAKTGIESDVY
jgi:wyosine [tRNA(Phe)-imidazoG37] synthetase (radical SAM superfamily)